MAIVIPRNRAYWKRKPPSPVELGGMYSPDDFTNAYIFNSIGTIPLHRDDVVAESAGISYDDEGVHVDGVAGTEILLDAPIDVTSQEGTIVARIKKGFTVANQINEGVFSDKQVDNWSTTGVSINIHRNGYLLLNIDSASTSDNTSSVFGDLDYHDIVCFYSASQQARIFVDGVEVSYTSQPTFPATLATSSHDAKVGAYYSDSGNFRSKASVSYLYSFNRRMDVSEALSISEAPYRILKPRRQYWTIPVEAGGGPTFQPAWAMASRRSNTIGAM